MDSEWQVVTVNDGAENAVIKGLLYLRKTRIYNKRVFFIGGSPALSFSNPEECWLEAKSEVASDDEIASLNAGLGLQLQEITENSSKYDQRDLRIKELEMEVINLKKQLKDSSASKHAIKGIPRPCDCCDIFTLFKEDDYAVIFQKLIK